MSLSCCRHAYSPRVKSPRRAGVAGGVGEGEVVAAGGVLEGDAAFFSEDASLNPTKQIKLIVHTCSSNLDLLIKKFKKSKSVGIYFV